MKKKYFFRDVESDLDEEHNEIKEEKYKIDSQLDISKIDEYDFDKYDEECKIINIIYYINNYFYSLYNINVNAAGAIHCNINNIAIIEKNGKDPFITKEDDDSEKEDDIIKCDDNLILVGHVEGDASILEIFGL